MRIRGVKNPGVALFLAIFLCLESTMPALQQRVWAQEVLQMQDSKGDASTEEQMINAALNYTKGTNAYVLDGNILNGAGSTGSDWFAFGCGRYGVEDNYAAYLTQLENYVSSCYAAHPTYGLNRNKATEWHRITFAVLACGGDPTAFGTKPDGSKVNLIADGVYNCIIGTPWKQGINGAIFGLLALDTKKYEVPEGSLYNRDQLISYILGKELAAGGFALYGAAADPDITGMALQALAPYYSTRSDVQAAVDRAVTVLSAMQQEDGGYASWGTANAESASQVLVALCSLGIDVKTDERFVTTSGKTLLDGLEQFYDSTSGGFRHILTGETDGMATQQAIYGLTAYIRFSKNDTALYDFTNKTGTEPPSTETPTPETTTPETPDPTPELTDAEEKIKIIRQLDTDIWDQIDPLRITQNDSAVIEALMSRYQKLSVEERQKLSNAASLIEASAVIQSLKKGIIPERVFQNIAQTKETFTYQGKVKNYDYTYSINGKDLKSKSSMNAAISLKTREIKQLESPCFSFKAGKAAAFNTAVTLKIKTNLSKGTYQAYRYHNKKKELQILAENVHVDKNGYVTLKLTSGGEYYISKGIISKEIVSNQDTSEDGNVISSTDTTQGTATIAKTESSKQSSLMNTDIGKDGIVTKRELESIIGTDKNFRVESKTEQGSWYAMTFAGENMTEASDVAIGISNSSQYEDEIMQLADHPYIISLAQDGSFPGDVLVELAVDMEDGEYVLFSYNVEKMCADAIQLVEVTDKQTKFIVASGGEYFIADKAKSGSLASAEEAELDGQEEVSDTEQVKEETIMEYHRYDWAVPAIAMVLAVLLAGGYYAKKKR